MELNFLSLILGLLGSSFFVASCFSIERPRILFLGVISSLLFIAGYLAKGDITAGAMVVTALTRNLLFMIERRHKFLWLTRKRVFYIMALTIVGIWFSGIALNGFEWYKLLIVISPLILLYGLSLDNVLHLKILTMINGLGWLSYEAITGAYTVMIGESVGLMMALLAIIRIANKIKIPKVST